MSDNNDDEMCLETEAAHAGCTVPELIEQATRHRDTELDPRFARPSLVIRITKSVEVYYASGRVFTWVRNYVSAGLHLPSTELVQDAEGLIPA